jgi:LssY C-terminus
MNKRALNWPILVLALLALLALLAGTPLVAQTSDARPGYLARESSRTDQDVQVSVAVLSDRESEALYGARLARKSIQPVWIKVENRGDRAYWLLSPGLDPNFFPASEAAEAIALDDPGADLDALDRRFRELAFKNPVLPGATASGFVLTNLHEGVKLVQIDLFAEGQSRSASFLAIVPGLRADYKRTETFRRDLYRPEDIVDFADDESFFAALEALPCCVANKDGSKAGDPLNLVIIGGIEDAFPALIRRGWSPSETTWSGSVMQMMSSALARERYPYAPISKLYLYGRPQDLALQKARDNIHQRNHLRLWRSPMRYRGKQVWVGQISRDIGSRLTIHSPTLTTHKIDPDVDGAALALAEDVVYSQGLQRLAFVAGVGAAPRNAPRFNLTRDPYFTQGMRIVLFFDRTPTSLKDIEILPWAGGTATRR